MTALLMTGFPGFLGSALLPRLLARRPGAHAVCLVQARHLGDARDAARRDRGRRAARGRPGPAGRWATSPPRDSASAAPTSACSRTSPRSGTWRPSTTSRCGEEVAHRVNVVGTDRVLDLCRGLPGLERLHHVSTCYVSGRYDGEFGEDELDVGQEFRNHYESTKYDAELLVRRAMAAGLPATIYRPGIVVGDSRTGATQKLDGPYFLATFLRRQPPVAVVPAVGDPDRGALLPGPPRLRHRRHGPSCRCWTCRWAGPTPSPTRTRRPCASSWTPSPHDSASGSSGCRCRCRSPGRWSPLPLAERLMGLPVEALDYFASPTTYDTTNTDHRPRRHGRDLPPLRGLRRPAARLHGRAPRARLRGHGLTPTDDEGRDMTPRTPVVVNVSLMGPERDHDTRVTFLGQTVPDRPPRHVRRRRRRLRARAGVGAAGRRRRRHGRPRGAGHRPVRRRAAGARAAHGRGRRRPPSPTAPSSSRSSRSGRSGASRPRCRATSPTPGPSCSAAGNHDRTVRILREHTDNIEHADPLLRLGLPDRLHTNPVLGLAADAVGGATGLALRLVPDGVRTQVAAPGHAGRARAGPQGGPRLRRPRRDVRRADRLRARGPRRQDPHHLGDLAGPAGRPR